MIAGASATSFAMTACTHAVRSRRFDGATRTHPDGCSFYECQGQRESLRVQDRKRRHLHVRWHRRWRRSGSRRHHPRRADGFVECRCALIRKPVAAGDAAGAASGAASGAAGADGCGCGCAVHSERASVGWGSVLGWAACVPAAAEGTDQARGSGAGRGGGSGGVTRGCGAVRAAGCVDPVAAERVGDRGGAGEPVHGRDAAGGGRGVAGASGAGAVRAGVGRVGSRRRDQYDGGGSGRVVA